MNEKSNEEIWREEFENIERGNLSLEMWRKLSIKTDGEYSLIVVQAKWIGYLAGRKAGQEEIDKLVFEKSVYADQIEQLELKLHYCSVPNEIHMKKVEEITKELRAENEKLCDEMIGYKAAVDKLKEQELEALKLENERLDRDNRWRLARFKDADTYVLKMKQENQRLKSLVERAKPWVIERKYARALDKKDYNEEVEWQMDAEKEGVK
jgi:hypothetical protein